MKSMVGCGVGSVDLAQVLAGRAGLWPGRAGTGAPGICHPHRTPT